MNGLYCVRCFIVCLCVCMKIAHRYVLNERWIHFEKQFHLTHDTKLFLAVITVGIIAPFFSILASNYFSTCNWCLWWFLHFTFASNIRMLVFSPRSNIQFSISTFQVIAIAHFESFTSHLHRMVWCDRTASFFRSSIFFFSPLLFRSFICLLKPKRKIKIQFEKLNGHCPANDIYSVSESQYCFFNQICYCLLGYDTISNFEMKSCENISH